METVRSCVGEYRTLLINGLSLQTTRKDVNLDELPRAIGEGWVLYKHGYANKAFDTFMNILTTPPIPDTTHLLENQSQPEEVEEHIEEVVVDQSEQPRLIDGRIPREDVADDEI